MDALKTGAAAFCGMAFGYAIASAALWAAHGVIDCLR